MCQGRRRAAQSDFFLAGHCATEQRLTHQVLCRLPRRLLRLGGLLLRDGPAERGRGRRRRRVEQERRRRLHVVRVRLEHPARQQAGAVGVGSRAKGSWRFEGRWGCAHMDSVLRSTSGNIAASRSSFTALSAIAVESTGPCCASPRSFARSAPDGAEPARQRRASCSGGCRAAAWPSWARAPESAPQMSAPADRNAVGRDRKTTRGDPNRFYRLLAAAARLLGAHHRHAES